ncbi:hypothetical protein SBI_09742 [Streptomyces bingchenggensis BCW-1]|uniref:Uncharacterized protein n=1 Tax=Streptomyces bingchenggensis (strain BCW-1) TaxID=749414 RepID=D7CBI3_STRBB|nr:hypothetical protein SBI_09742 [Streptomyces bingchenggensis BCW-1]
MARNHADGLLVSAWTADTRRSGSAAAAHHGPCPVGGLAAGLGIPVRRPVRHR